MSIKNTELYKWIREKYYKYLNYKNYQFAKNMPECEYEDYLIKKYPVFMNKHEYSKGKTLSLENPKTFTEKSQWIKLYDQDLRKNIYSDKYEVRDFIRQTIGAEYLVPLISIDGKEFFNSFKEIDFDKLPNRFVLKCTHGSHMNIIVKDKSKLTQKSIRLFKKKITKWLKTNYTYYVSLETQYENIIPRIIIENYCEDISDDKARDYKFMCFNGKCHYFWINEDCVDEKNETCTTFNRDLSIAPFNMNVGYRKNISNMNLPSNINEMIEIADRLSSGFTFVRVDLYNMNGKIYFGEMTFNSAAGYDAPNPIEYDEVLGNIMKIDLSKREGNYKYRKNENN